MISTFMLLGLTFLGLVLAPNVQGESAGNSDDDVEDVNATETDEPNFLDALFEAAEGTWLDEQEIVVDNTTVANRNLIKGSSDDDALLGTDIDDVIVGGEGEDLLQGGDGSDLLDGLSGETENETDYLRGGNGNDTLIGNGMDRMNGGAGSDVFVTTIGDSHVGPVCIDDYDDETDYIVIRHSSTEPPPTITTQTTDSATIVLANSQPIAVLEGVVLFDMKLVVFAEH